MSHAFAVFTGVSVAVRLPSAVAKAISPVWIFAEVYETTCHSTTESGSPALTCRESSKFVEFVILDLMKSFPSYVDGGERDVDGRAGVRLGPTLDGDAAEELGEVPLDRDRRRSRGDDALESESRRVEEGPADLALLGLHAVEPRAQEEERPCCDDGCDREVDRGIHS